MFIYNLCTRADVEDREQQDITEVLAPSQFRNEKVGFEPCSKIEDLNLEVKRKFTNRDGENLDGESSRRYRVGNVLVYSFSSCSQMRYLYQMGLLDTCLSYFGLKEFKS
ncbi:hypothetical protein Tco_0365783 [Tanacetum coccineum]